MSLQGGGLAKVTVLILVLAFATPGGIPGRAPAGDAPPLRILFAGNSDLETNDLPSMFDDEAGRRVVETALLAAPDHALADQLAFARVRTGA